MEAIKELVLWWWRTPSREDIYDLVSTGCVVMVPPLITAAMFWLGTPHGSNPSDWHVAEAVALVVSIGSIGWFTYKHGLVRLAMSCALFVTDAVFFVGAVAAICGWVMLAGGRFIYGLPALFGVTVVITVFSAAAGLAHLYLLRTMR
jgi:hypothetical protein